MPTAETWSEEARTAPAALLTSCSQRRGHSRLSVLRAPGAQQGAPGRAAEGRGAPRARWQGAGAARPSGRMGGLANTSNPGRAVLRGGHVCGQREEGMVKRGQDESP